MCTDINDFQIDRMLLLQRLKYFVAMQNSAETELRAKGCSGVFGDAQSDWAAAWIFSCESNAAAVCSCLRRAIALSDSSKDNAFVAAKARYNLTECCEYC